MYIRKHTNTSIYQTIPPDMGIHNKLKNNRTLAPLLYIPTYETRAINSQGKFVVRKASKSDQMKSTTRGNFYLYKGNNHNIIKQILEEMGYIQTTNKQHCKLIWYQSKEAPRKDYLSKQFTAVISNYLPHHYEITNKQFLFQNIAKFDPSAIGTIIPKTFVIDFKDLLNKIQTNLTQFLIEYFKKLGISHPPKKSSSLYITNIHGQFCIPFVKVFKLMRERNNNNSNNQQSPTIDIKTPNKTTNLWIVKPSSLNRGQGIQIISNLQQLQKMLSQDNQQISIKMYQSEQKSVNSFVIQEYIMNPLLYEGYKFDIRVWALLRTSKANGLEVYIYKQAYSRLASHKYIKQMNGKSHEDLINSQQSNTKKTELTKSSQNRRLKSSKSGDTNDLYIHLTNNAYQKNCKQYGLLHEGNQLLLSDLIKRLNIQNLTQQYLQQRFQRILTLLISSCKQKLQNKSGYGNFQLIGLDFMIDANLNVWLIQANCNPCLEESSMILKVILPKMIKEMFKIVRISKIMGLKDNKEQLEVASYQDSHWKRLM